jgi:hypothetical protein
MKTLESVYPKFGRWLGVRMKAKRDYAESRNTKYAGTYHSEWDGVTLYPGNAQMSGKKNENDYESVIRTVWERARYLAEREAEFEREENAKEAARNKAADLRSERADLIKVFRQAKRALRKARAIVENDGEALPLLTIARDRVGDVLRERRHINGKIAELIRDNPAAFE